MYATALLTILLARTALGSLVVSTVNVPGAPGVFGTTNLQNPRWLHLAGTTLYIGGTRSQTSASTNAGPMIQSVEVDGGFALGPLNNVAGGNPTAFGVPANKCPGGGVLYDGVGTNAMFSGFAPPFVINPAGDKLYASDTHSQLLRTVSLGAADYGLVTTFVGPQFCSASFCTKAGVPTYGCATGQQGYLDGTFSTAALMYPSDLEFDPSDATRLFFAESGAYRIRLANLATQTVSTVAGGGALYGPPSYTAPVLGYAGAFLRNATPPPPPPFLTAIPPHSHTTTTTCLPCAAHTRRARSQRSLPNGF